MKEAVKGNNQDNEDANPELGTCRKAVALFLILYRPSLPELIS